MVKKEVWIRPEYALNLNAVEKILYQADIQLEEGELEQVIQMQWTTTNLQI